MVRFVFGIIFVVCGIIAWFAAKGFQRQLVQQRDLSTREVVSREAPSLYASGTRMGARITLGLGLLLIVWSTVRVVPANHVGIPTEFGSIGNPLNSGFQFTTPWTDITKFSTRMQELSMLGAADDPTVNNDDGRGDSIEVRGSDGYVMWSDVTVRYFIEGDSASDLFRLVGSEDGVKERLVRPEVREAVRVEFAKWTAEQGYTSERDAIREAIFADLEVRLARYGLRLDSVAVRNVAPDPVLANAISERAAARERALQATIQQGTDLTLAETRKLVAETDAAAKVAAAQGEADANRILAASITDEILMLKRIEALRDANTVYVPDGTQILVAANGSTPT